MSKKRILIMGAAGRDFHNFNTYFRNNKDYEVVAFTATQIPDIAGRKYPAALAGKLYPKGISIYDEKDLTKLIAKLKVDQVVFAYSDVPYAYVMGKAAVVNAAGADFMMLGPKDTMIKSTKPLISVCAVRTGSGKSQTTRRVIEILMAMGKKVVAIRHPMPYGDLVKQKVQRFATVEDLAKHKCTIEEMEEYEPHVVRGNVIYAGVDYEAILRQAEKEADVIVWDGGNNDFSFYKSDLEIVVVDPHRPGHELSYYPGEVNLRRADVIIINKEDSARKEDIKTVKANIKMANPRALVIDADSPVTVEQPKSLKGKRVLVIEDGPTLTHGEMKYGAGVVAAKKHGVAKMIDPRPYAVGTIADTFKKYPGIGVLLPAMGYSDKQISDLQATINRTPCDMYVVGTPIDLRRLVKFPKPAVRVSYDLKETSKPDLSAAIRKIIKK
ncbi:MAG: cyclic 2,3-diphosphoglycerate synthase [Candidatus Edwardsbacteria bacterium]|nr:cyclic 2,3-diphosphoglycerate synthase [Candidatus Edwardsbacteria bacterium]MBU1576377.1 cyclic 2,3-diphosphoglycerate synthase [Candidatus Edwardsbacteria bacterium]MBU2463838.1 cyclic 2,3-diphosphoglycerate synthase [Candidatus Edwardsbacteria bacterium]MBU2593554.1 cyclic 2,3-diphosphoglycerate synthase [Candidatus Edwardsbacteria bacterium]